MSQAGVRLSTNYELENQRKITVNTFSAILQELQLASTEDHGYSIRTATSADHTYSIEVQYENKGKDL